MTQNHNQIKRTRFFLRIKSFSVHILFFLHCVRRRIMCCDEMWFWLLYFDCLFSYSCFAQVLSKHFFDNYLFLLLSTDRLHSIQRRKNYEHLMWRGFVCFSRLTKTTFSVRQVKSWDGRAAIFDGELICFGIIFFQIQFERFVTHSIQMNTFIWWHRIIWHFPWTTNLFINKKYLNSILHWIRLK